MEISSCLKIQIQAVMLIPDRVCQGDEAPKEGATSPDYACCPIKLPNETLKMQFGAFTFGQGFLKESLVLLHDLRGDGVRP